MALLFPQFNQGSLREATVWTDGRMVGPWIPEELALVGCPFCAETFWTRESLALGTANESYSDTRWPEARFVTELDAAAILQAVVVGRADTPRKEKYLRLHAWWRDGDRRREGVAKELDLTAPGEEMRANMRRLHLLADEEMPDDRLMKAELSRQLGRFEEVQHLLAFEFTREEHVKAAARIRELSLAGETTVAKVDFPLGPEAATA
ncbi:MAG: hypothetical protein RL318_1826 [Fibrobacterota bacterium]|jgi:hypothetical protein